MTAKGIVPEIVQAIYPGAEILGVKKRPYRNSTVFLISLDHPRRKVVAKVSRYVTLDQISREYEALTRFYLEKKDPRVSCPEPLYCDPETGVSVMGSVEGTNLALALHGLRPLEKDRLEEAVDLSALALAEYHRVVRLPWETPLYADRSARERDIHGCLLDNCSLAARAALRFKVRPFFDFSAWNLMIGGPKRVYLLDFPKTDYVSTPHLDLGRFRFSLELIKQYPPSKFLGWDSWDISSLYGRFLEAYCSEVGFDLREEDRHLIDCFTRASIKRSQDTSRKDKFHWQSRLERLYLRIFARSWIKGA